METKKDILILWLNEEREEVKAKLNEYHSNADVLERIQRRLDALDVVIRNLEIDAYKEKQDFIISEKKRKAQIKRMMEDEETTLYEVY